MVLTLTAWHLTVSKNVWYKNLTISMYSTLEVTGERSVKHLVKRAKRYSAQFHALPLLSLYL